MMCLKLRRYLVEEYRTSREEFSKLCITYRDCALIANVKFHGEKDTTYISQASHFHWSNF